MALTRSFLKGLGITDDQMSAIIEAHTESTDALKTERDKYKAEADKVEGIQKELDDLKEKAKGDDWQNKFEKEHSDFEAYKTAIETEKINASKKDAYTALLKAANVSDKAIPIIIKALDLNDIELGEDGKISNADALNESIKTSYADFITTTEKSGAETKTPPENNQGNVINSLEDALKEKFMEG